MRRLSLATTALVVFALSCPVVHALFLNEGLVTDMPLTSWWLFPTHSTPTTFTPVSVAVPNTVVGALVDAGYYPFDPFYGENLKRIDPQDFDQPWTYSTQFTVTDASSTTASVVHILYLDGINYRGNVTLNGVVVVNDTTLFGALQRFEFDVTAYISTSAPNNLSVSLMRPQRDPGQWRNKYPDLALSFDDWNPHPPDLSMGLWRPVGIRTVHAPESNAKALFTFDGFVVQTTLKSTDLPDGSTATTAYLNVSVVAKYWGDAAINESFTLTLPSFNGTSSTTTPLILQDVYFGTPQSEVRLVWTWEEFETLTVPQPPLWWPWQLHDSRPFFNATVGISGHKEASARYRFALRQASGALTLGGSLQFYINNVPLNIRSGGWAPDMFQRENYDRMVTDFIMIRDMGLNAIRLKGNVMNEDFFDVADELGILVTPGFGCCDGWQHWDLWPEANYVAAAQSLRKQARRLESHPSVAGFLLASDELPPVRVEIMYRAVLGEEGWPNVVISSASQQTSYVSGPSGVKMVGPYSWEPPTYWLEDGDGLAGNGTMNYGGAWGFLTEGGPGEAPMTLNSWQRTVPKEHLWNETTKSLDEWWSFHMGCPFGHFRNLTFYSPPLNARYGESHSAQTYLYRAQAANLEGIRSMYESYARNKHINATGVVQWQIKMAWPSHLWHLYDWYFVSGGGFYGAKRALEHLHAMFSYTDGSIWLINGDFDTINGPVVVTADVMTVDGRSLWHAETSVTTVPPDASLDLASAGLLVPKEQLVAMLPPNSTYFVRLTWHADGPGNAKDIPTKAHPATNWYWISTRDDILDWDASNGFRTPCTQFGDFGNLNTMLQLPNMSVTSSISTTESHFLAPWMQSKGGIFADTPLLHVTLTNGDNGIVFLVHVRLVNTTTGHDVAPLMCDDNFFTLAPSEVHRIHCVAVGVSAADLQAKSTLVVESYNDRVTHEGAIESMSSPIGVDAQLRQHAHRRRD